MSSSFPTTSVETCGADTTSICKRFAQVWSSQAPRLKLERQVSIRDVTITPEGNSAMIQRKRRDALRVHANTMT
eukprot:6089967-Amphidinium_carterae.1